jgi:hypothetical protein
MLIQIIVGYILILLGVGFLVLSVLVWFGVIKPKPKLMLSDATLIEILIAMIQYLPWTATVGVLLIYAGIKMIGVPLPF